MDVVQFRTLVERNWQRVKASMPGGFNLPELTYRLGPNHSYPHFQTARGFAVTFYDGMNCDVLYAEKILQQHPSRVEGIVRHEFGHVLDFYVPQRLLIAWAFERGVRLPLTTERRADEIARAVWGRHLLYDTEDVQNTRSGVTPRPTRLGL